MLGIWQFQEKPLIWKEKEPFIWKEKEKTMNATLQCDTSEDGRRTKWKVIAYYGTELSQDEAKQLYDDVIQTCPNQYVREGSCFHNVVPDPVSSDYWKTFTWVCRGREEALHLLVVASDKLGGMSEKIRKEQNIAKGEHLWAQFINTGSTYWEIVKELENEVRSLKDRIKELEKEIEGQELFFCKAVDCSSRVMGSNSDHANWLEEANKAKKDFERKDSDG